MRGKLIVFVGIALLFTAFFWFDLQQYLTLSAAQAFHLQVSDYIQANFIQSSLYFFMAYIGITAFSIPGAAVVTLLGAALFGFWWSLLLVSFASTLGASIAFLMSRFLLKDWVQKEFGHRLQSFNDGFEKEGATYLFTLRLIPIFPFFLINLLMGLTPIRLRQFYWVSQLGMLPGTAVYLNAGTQLAQIESLQGLVSANVLFSLALLGVFPIFAKKINRRWQQSRLMKKWQKPKSFDRNLVVIGAGAGGLVTSYIGAAVKAKVTLIEKHHMGGDCLNTGCVPSKAILRSAKARLEIHHANDFGLNVAQVEVDFPAVMARVKAVIQKIEPHDSIERYTKLGVECVQGEAKIISPWEVSVNDQILTAKNIVIATGARPLVPDIEGLQSVNYFTSDTIWSLKEQPKDMVILGGGPIGCELAQAFALLGTQIHLVEMQSQLLSREDQDVADLLHQHLTAAGVMVYVNHAAVKFGQDNGRDAVWLKHQNDGSEVVIPFDSALLALGRVANVTGFGLENLGIQLTERGTIAVNQYLQTNLNHIYAVGDVAGPFQFTHAAGHQAWYAAVNALFGSVKKFQADYRVMPAVTYTFPEIARVGLNEKEALEQGIDFEVTRYELDDLDRAIADSADLGWVKIITAKGKDRILGATIVGAHAGELLAEFTFAMKHGLGLNKILGTIHPYPTFSEATKYTAGIWKQNHAPQGAFKWLKRFHAWQRGASSN